MALRCLIVDDSPWFLEVARGLLEREGIVVVGPATNGDDAVPRAVDHVRSVHRLLIRNITCTTRMIGIARIGKVAPVAADADVEAAGMPRQ